MAQETEGQSEVWVQRGKEWDKEWWRNGKLNDVYMDVGLTGQPHQASTHPSLHLHAPAHPQITRLVLMNDSVSKKTEHATKWQRKSTSKAGYDLKIPRYTNVCTLNPLTIPIPPAFSFIIFRLDFALTDHS